MRASLLLLAVLLTACPSDPVGEDPTPEDPIGEDPPPLYVVSMMHAEESISHHQNETIYRDFADALEQQRSLFGAHGAKLDFGPDWTFIEGVRTWDPTQLEDHVAAGQGLHTHAHETQFDLANVHMRLAQAGAGDNLIANGGFLQEGPGGTNWIGYVEDFDLPGGAPMFTTAIGYKNPQTQIPDTTGTCFRPSAEGEWTEHDPDGRLLYLGSNSPDEAGAGALDFDTFRDWLDARIAGVDPDALLNTAYWHDSLHKYGDPTEAADRRARWEQEFEEYLDPLVADGTIVWATFEEMTAACLAAEAR